MQDEPWRVLFVDDEPFVLEGLMRSLFDFDEEFDCDVATSGPRALELIDEDGPYDVIVSDMRMPGMDGAELLSRVVNIAPNALRVVLSGHAELEASMRALAIAHHFLKKPAKTDVLVDVLRTSLEWRKAVLAPEIVAFVEQRWSPLPTMERYQAVRVALRRRRASSSSPT